ncbi:MAG: hypothetical protein IT406_03775 [Candidatus Yanofskybacteria bacterium]|nr:hypothetical protein [Candidatus Yanofskybacteria bacterium]
MSFSSASVFKRFERVCWYLFVATAAWQTRLIVWQADAQFNEWRSASVYASDVFMIALIISALIATRGRFLRRIEASDWALGFVFAAGVFSLGHAEQLTVGVIQLARLAQFIVLYLYLRAYAWQRFSVDLSVLVFVAGALVQAMLGIGQYIAQHDLGLRWLGETLLRTDMRGVAVFYDLGYTKVLRAYGTLPHPNILAAYLMVALWFVAWLWAKYGSRVWFGVLVPLLWGFFLTFSRTVIAVWAGAWTLLAGTLWMHRGWPNSDAVRVRMRALGVVALVTCAVFAALYWPQIRARLTISASDEAVRLRVTYAADAVATGGWSWLHINWTGVGIGNFTTWLAGYDRTLPPSLIQPAHNVFLMVYAEMGVLGLLAWLVWLALVVRMAWRAHRGQPIVRAGILSLVVGLFVVGMFDHFFWTLQQGRILWWGVLALAAGKAEFEKEKS